MTAIQSTHVFLEKNHNSYYYAYGYYSLMMIRDSWISCDGMTQYEGEICPTL